LVSGIAFLYPFAGADWITISCEDLIASEPVGYMAMGLPYLLMLIVTFLRNRRKNGIGFGGALLSGIIVTVIASMSFYVVNGIFYTMIEPDFLLEFEKVYSPCMIEWAENEMMQEAIVARIRDMQPFFENGWKYSLLMAATSFMVGVVMTLIVALFHGLLRLTKF
jgi:hypothetical protein